MTSRHRLSLLLALGCTLVASPRGARAEAAPDSSGFFPAWMHASILAGVSWMQSPHEVSDRYTPGLALGGSLSLKPAPRLRVSAEVDYLDLPSDGNGYYGTWQSNNGVVSSTALGSQQGLGMGHAIPVLGLVTTRVWRGLWLEGGAGVGYFDSGYPDIQFIDGVTGDWVSIPGRSGWGAAAAAGLSYEFKVRSTDHLYASFRWMRLARDPAKLDFVPLRLGYRFD